MKKKISRREFIGRCTAVAAGSLAAPRLFQVAAQAAPPPTTPPPDIFVVKNGPPAEMVAKVFDRFGGVGAIVKKGSKVVLKPNMTWALPPTIAGNTHPQVAAAIAQQVLTANPNEVIALDHPLRRGAFEISEVKPALEKVKGVKVLKTDSEDFYKRVKIPRGRVINEPILVSKDILDADVIINIPNAKTHGSAVVTFGMKNWMGVIYDRQYFHRHGLQDCIAELSSSINPALIIVDATRIALWGGPNNSNPSATRNLNMLIAGKDQLAVDAYTVGIAQWHNKQWKPQDIRQLTYAAELGVGRIDVDKLKVEVLDMKA